MEIAKNYNLAKSLHIFTKDDLVSYLIFLLS